MKQILKILNIILLLSTLSISQNFQKMEVTGGNAGKLTYLTKRYNDFVSAKELSQILGKSFNFNPVFNSFEIKSGDNKLKFVGKNQFIVLTNSKNKKPKIFQMPISSLMVNDDLFIPIQYSIYYLNDFLNLNLSYDKDDKQLTVKIKSSYEPDAYVDDLSDYDSKVVDNYDLFGLEIEKKFNGTQITFKSNKNINRHTKSIINNKLLVTISGVSIFPEIEKEVEVTGLIKSIEVKQLTEMTTQFEFALKKGYTNADSFIDESTNDLIISVQNNVFKNDAINFADEAAKWNFDVVVIDPGHGGKDPGAIGVTGVYEKDVNLGIALKLGNLISRQLKDVQVIYTRKTDKFVELFKRGKIANENNGKLFISIHCNSLPKKSRNVRGFETYLLRPGRTDEAIKIAERENSVIEYEDNPNLYQELTDENFILVSMAHSANMRYAEKFSDILNREMERNNVIPSRGVKQAGFYVLVGASMPGILFEAGFLSNRKDEKFLKSHKGQTEIARRMFNSIKAYKEYYEQMMKEEL